MVEIILLEPIFPVMDNCCNCGCEVELYQWKPNYGIPRYEGLPVPKEYTGEWGGFTTCKPCFDLYENGLLPMWKLNDKGELI